MKVSVLGVDYRIIFEDMPNDNYDGRCDFTAKEIRIACMKEHDCADKKIHMEKVIRHEIVHAFLYESGLDVNSDWARNEELVDWIALQFYKLGAAFAQVEIPEGVI